MYELADHQQDQLTILIKDDETNQSEKSGSFRSNFAYEMWRQQKYAIEKRNC
jgi:hypothetical protein